jgi:hypothetical protein
MTPRAPFLPLLARAGKAQICPLQTMISARKVIIELRRGENP